MASPTRITSSVATPTATELILFVADEGTFEAWDEDVVFTADAAPSERTGYARRLAEAESRSGRNESIVTGRALVNGRALALIAGEFAFLGGSIGTASGERVARAFERATAAQLPVLTLVASGGTRVQEGALAFVQMVKTAQAVRAHRATGLLYVAYLAHPSMGGALASWGSLGHLTFAMPGALIGFSGPRVMDFTTGRSPPPGTQQAENLMRHGLVDEVFPPEALRARVDRLLSALEARDVGARPRGATGPEPEDGDPWVSVQRSRAADRPGVRQLLEACATNLTFMRGDGHGGGDDRSCIAAIGQLAGIPSVVIGQDRAASDIGARMTPAGYRKARRAMRVAADLRLPLVTVVDTPGAELSAAAEEGGLAAEIARCLLELTELRSPTVSVLLGEGGGGGALALLPADRVVCAENAWLSPIAPEGASAIVHRSVEKAAELARDQGIASWELKRAGIVNMIVAEGDDASRDGAAFLARLTATMRDALTDSITEDADERLAARARRYRAIGDR